MIRKLLRKRLHRPEALGLLLHDLTGRRRPVQNARRHLVEAAEWILGAQAATPDDGVAGAYTFEDGWVASYPETTGYIVPTLLATAEVLEEPRYGAHALRMAGWLLTVQYDGGGFPGHFVDRRHPPIVFNTGQILFGLVAAHQATGDERFLVAARRAGDWLLETQDPDGAWRKFDYRGQVHTYNTRTAWALVELGLCAQRDEYVKGGERNLDWALGQQEPNGWFRECTLTPGRDPNLHAIAYTSQGLLEAGLRLDRSDYVAAGRRTCDAVLVRMRASGWIAGTFDRSWRGTARWSCLTGNAQMSAQWLRLRAVTGESAYLEAGLRANHFLKSLHDCETPNRHVRGAVKGSHPIWGRYLFGSFPNWAAKFFMDALLLEHTAELGDKTCIRCW